MWLELLPKDVLADILLLLPMESLVSLACSNKYLYHFITNPFFTIMLFRRSVNNPLIFFKYYSRKRYKQYYSLQKDDASFHVGNDPEVQMPVDCPYERCFNVVGSVNGVICLTDDLYNDTEYIALWNPCIRKLFQLPEPSINLESDGEMGVVVGFGCGFIGGVLDYKVVRLAYVGSTYRVGNCTEPPLVEVFSLKDRCWKSVTCKVPLFDIRHTMSSPPYSHCFVRKWCHWPSWKDNAWNGIVTFDLFDEVFGLIGLPEGIKGSKCCDCELKVFQFRMRNSIALVHIQHYSYEDSKRVFTNAFSVWVMRNYGVGNSWLCVYKASGVYPIPRTFLWRKNMDLLSLMGGSSNMHKERKHTLYSLLRSNVELGHVKGIPNGFHLCSYTESMSLFKEGKYVADSKASNEDDVEYEGSESDESEVFEEFVSDDELSDEEEEEEDDEGNENGGQE